LGGVGPGTGGIGAVNPITGSTSGELSGGLYYLAGGGGSGNNGGTIPAGGLGGGGAGTNNTNPGSYAIAGTTNTGGGGGGCTGSSDAKNGGSGIVILKYPDTFTITVGPGLTGTTGSPSGGFKVTTITAGTGNVSWN
jgi:hypothetical protein